MQKC